MFKSIGIIGKHRTRDVTGTIITVIDYLLSRKINVIIEQDTSRALSKKYSLPTLPRQQLGKHCDLVVVVGGDGSLLHAARAISAHHTPVVGVNLGRLGFLTDILPAEIASRLGSILDGRYQEEKRFLLHMDVIDQDKMIADGEALNEVVLLPGDTAQLIEFEIIIDGKFVCTHRADGIIVATPTGSTAYALSGGGPILHPKLDAIVLVPMFPHTLSSRPLVVDGNSVVDIVITEHNQSSPRSSCDGQARIPVPPGARIHIQKKAEPLRLIHPFDHDFYETLRSKLGWVTR